MLVCPLCANRALTRCSKKHRCSITSSARGRVTAVGFKDRAAGRLAFALSVEPLLIVRRVIREQLGILHRRLLAIVRDDDVCRRLMTIPGVGPVVALTYRATVDVP